MVELRDIEIPVHSNSHISTYMLSQLYN